MSKFIVPTNLENFNSILEKNEYVLADFTATWCGPCRMVTPALEKLAGVYENVVFVKIDVDELADIAAEHQIRAMPTLFFFKNQQKVSEIVGANIGAIEKNLISLVA